MPSLLTNAVQYNPYSQNDSGVLKAQGNKFFKADLPAAMIKDYLTHYQSQMGVKQFALLKANELYSENQQLKSSLAASKTEARQLLDSLDAFSQAQR